MGETSTTGLLSASAERLRSAGVESPRREARLLLAHALAVKPLDIVAGKLPAITEEILTHFETLVVRRSAREPLAYIVGSREFWSVEFRVGPGVLIPRPESEVLVEAALKRFPDQQRPLRVLDLGTGSGCLLLTFLSERPRAEGVGIDISPDALAIAESNARGLGLAERAQFVESDWTRNLSGRFDAIFINPPYVRHDEIAALAPEVARYEPRIALDGGPDGLGSYRDVARGLKDHLNPHGAVFFEIGTGQREAVGTILAEIGFNLEGTLSDLAGIPRCLVATAELGASTPKKQLALATRSG